MFMLNFPVTINSVQKFTTTVLVIRVSKKVVVLLTLKSIFDSSLYHIDLSKSNSTNNDLTKIFPQTTLNNNHISVFFKVLPESLTSLMVLMTTTMKIHLDCLQNYLGHEVDRNMAKYISSKG